MENILLSIYYSIWFDLLVFFLLICTASVQLQGEIGRYGKAAPRLLVLLCQSLNALEAERVAENGEFFIRFNQHLPLGWLRSTKGLPAGIRSFVSPLASLSLKFTADAVELKGRAERMRLSFQEPLQTQREPTEPHCTSMLQLCYNQPVSRTQQTSFSSARKTFEPQRWTLRWKSCWNSVSWGWQRIVYFFRPQCRTVAL